MPDKVKNSHYLPRQAYLSRFAKGGNILVYPKVKNKELGISEPFSTTPRKFGRENYLYEAPGVPENLIEKILKPIEDSYQGVFEDKIAKHEPLTDQEINSVGLFISALEMRIPAQKEHWKSELSKVQKMGIQIARAHGSNNAEEQFVQEIEAYKANVFVDGLVIAIKENRWRFADYCFLYIEDSIKDLFFITSDHPTSLIDYTLMNGFYGIPPASRTIELTIPISKNMALFINNMGISGYRSVTHNFIDEINIRTINRAHGYIISPDELTNNFNKRISRHYPQSLLLKYINPPKGNIDRLLAETEEGQNE